MLIATTFVAAALLASSVFEEAPSARPAPPLAVGVTADAALPSALVSRILDEAAAIWRPAGVTFAWQRDAAAAPQALHVTIGRSTGRRTDEALPLAWIVFEDAAPDREIYVSYANVLTLVARSPGVVGRLDDMPRGQLETLLGRALGRALAHEVGHYLLASKTHTATGLMQTRRTAAELFSTARARFDVDASQRQRIAARVQQLMLAQRLAADAVSEGL